MKSIIFPNQYFLILLYLNLQHCLFTVSASVSHDSNNASVTTPLAAITCLPEQSSLLLQLKQEFLFDQKIFFGPGVFVDGSPEMKTWKEGQDCCEWDGVTCEMATGHVVGLDLSSWWLRVRGPFLSNSTLFRLHRLQRLNLAYNDFSGSAIPSTFGQLSRLTHLNLSGSGFYGEIPFEISRLANLVSLDLSQLGLYFGSTTIFHNITKLMTLHLDLIDLSSIVQVEKLLANVSNSLTTLSLSECNLKKFPQHIWHLPKIESIDLSSNENLTGFLPEFSSNNNLKSLDLSWTGFSGTLPNSIGKLKSLNILLLSSCRFSGPIPSSVWNLSQLTSLDLSWNNFEGQLPPTIENLSQLTLLRLSFNNFNDTLPPAIGNLSLLTSLYLSSNNFIGTLPPAIGNLSQLTKLSIKENNFNGQLPTTLGNLIKLNYLHLSQCEFSGEIPLSFGSLTQLENLDLSWNNFSGQLITSLRSLKQLYYISLSNNRFLGTLPRTLLANLTKLSYFDISYNELTGSLPPFNSSSSISHLDLSHNLFIGTIPSSLFFLSIQYLNLSHNQFNSLPDVKNDSAISINTLDLRSNQLQGSVVVPPYSTQIFFISENNLSGSLPHLFCNLTNLKILDASNNNFGGVIPQCLGGLGNAYLSVLNLQRNNFHGNMPEKFSNEGELRTLELGYNKLTGKVPRSLINCTSLEVFNLGHNHIRDGFPFWLEGLPELQVLVLRSNEFYGPIWHQQQHHVRFVKLRIIDLAFNKFSGKIPSEYFKNWSAFSAKSHNDNDESHLRYMKEDDSYYQDSVTVVNKGLEMVLVKILTIFTSIDLSHNFFQGEIPSTIGDLHSLIVLNLSSNNFQGPISPTFGNLTELESLDLSGNNLSGNIPRELASLTFLQYLNLSDNNLSGLIPRSAQFDTFENSSFGGNLGLCGWPLSKKCLESVARETPNPEHDGHSRDQESESESSFGWKPVLIGYVCGFLVAAVGGHFILSKNPNLIVKIYGRKM